MRAVEIVRHKLRSAPRQRIWLCRPLFDELRRPEREAVEAERQLAEQEVLVIALKRQGQDII